MRNLRSLLLGVFLLGTLTACSAPVTPTEEAGFPTPFVSPVEEKMDPSPTPTPSPTLAPPRVLSICAQEPTSLFLYGDTSPAARSILQAIYDGPIDVEGYRYQPVILERLPSVENGDAFLRPTEVSAGALIVDAEGNWASLNEGVVYRPSGCREASCAEPYTGGGPVQMDELVLRFRLLPNLRWADGMPLTARDSVFSFEVFRQLFESLSPEALRYVRSYTALDDQTVEWVGIPGYVGSFPPKFFSPLPEHRLAGLPWEGLPAPEVARRSPLGWGPFMIEAWVVGDHITLQRNPYYFRRAEGLPRVDTLVFRFVKDGDEAIDALLAGECDLVDSTVLQEDNFPRLQAEQQAGRLNYFRRATMAWELLAFGVDTLQGKEPRYFASPAVRRAVAHCIDRQEIATRLWGDAEVALDSYLPSTHPLHNADIPQYSHDVEEAAALLTAAGWVDYDQDPASPRTAVGIPGILDGTPLSFTYLVPDDSQRLRVAQMVRDGLAACGIEAQIEVWGWEPLLGPGPEGPLFGRQFDLAQFAWSGAVDPPCFLFLSEEIPGPYPESPKGWGGANLAGYANPAFDSACKQALNTLPGTPAWREAYQQAETILATDLPIIPLYTHNRMLAMRPDLCYFPLNEVVWSELQAVEEIDYGERCKN